MLRLIGGERGAYSVIAALGIIVFVGFAALTVDVGLSYYYRSQAQSAADAAALAGMHTKLRGGSDAEILADAEQYALFNELSGHEGTEIALSMVPGGPGTVIGEDFVQVEVQKRARYIFAPVLSLVSGGDHSGSDIRARALARRVFLTGVRNLEPWGAMVIKSTRMFATVDEGGTVELTNAGGDEWTASLPIPNDEDDDDDGFLVDLTIHNGQDFPVVFEGVGSVYVHEGTSLLTNAYLESETVVEGESTTLHVWTTTPPTQARVAGSVYNSWTDHGGGHYSTSVSAPGDINGTFGSFPVQVKLGGSDTYDDVTVLNVGKVTHSVMDIDIANGHRTAGGTVTITVTMQDLIKDELYDLKIASDPESGNFNSLDYRYITHPDGTEHGASGSAADYYDNVEYGYDGIVHIGDVIQTKTGNLSGPTTNSRLDSRFSSCNLTYQAWKDAGRPGCSRVVIVPIIERIERMTGTTDVKVIEFGAFWVTEYGLDSGGSDIRGLFIDYAAPGEYTTTPPDTGIYLETSRLETPGY